MQLQESSSKQMESAPASVVASAPPHSCDPTPRSPRPRVGTPEKVETGGPCVESNMLCGVFSDARNCLWSERSDDSKKRYSAFSPLPPFGTSVGDVSKGEEALTPEAGRRDISHRSDRTLAPISSTNLPSVSSKSGKKTVLIAASSGTSVLDVSHLRSTAPRSIRRTRILRLVFAIVVIALLSWDVAVVVNIERDVSELRKYGPSLRRKVVAGASISPGSVLSTSSNMFPESKDHRSVVVGGFGARYLAHTSIAHGSGMYPTSSRLVRLDSESDQMILMYVIGPTLSMLPVMPRDLSTDSSAGATAGTTSQEVQNISVEMLQRASHVDHPGGALVNILDVAQIIGPADSPNQRVVLALVSREYAPSVTQAQPGLTNSTWIYAYASDEQGTFSSASPIRETEVELGNSLTPFHTPFGFLSTSQWNGRELRGTLGVQVTPATPMQYATFVLEESDIRSPKRIRTTQGTLQCPEGVTHPQARMVPSTLNADEPLQDNELLVVCGRTLTLLLVTSAGEVLETFVAAAPISDPAPSDAALSPVHSIRGGGDYPSTARSVLYAVPRSNAVEVFHFGLISLENTASLVLRNRITVPNLLGPVRVSHFPLIQWEGNMLVAFLLLQCADTPQLVRIVSRVDDKELSRVDAEWDISVSVTSPLPSLSLSSLIVGWGRSVSLLSSAAKGQLMYVASQRGAYTYIHMLEWSGGDVPIGVALHAAQPGEDVHVLQHGILRVVTTAQNRPILRAGAVYYASEDGTIALHGQIPVGRALSGQELFVDFTSL